MILLTTAGKLGSEAALPEKATMLAQAGADVFEGDLDVPANIDAAMQGVTSPPTLLARRG